MNFFKNKETGLDKSQISIERESVYNIKTPAIRLYYVAFEKFTRYGTDEIKIGQTYGASSPFRLPHNMSMENACKVVSYLSDKVEKENHLEPACEQSVIMVSNILEEYGFSKVEGEEKGHYHIVSEYIPFHTIRASFPATEEIKGVVDLFSVGGDFKIFKKTDLYDRYFEWYTEGITEKEVVDIYKSIGQEYCLSNNTNSEDEKNL